MNENKSDLLKEEENVKKMINNKFNKDEKNTIYSIIEYLTLWKVTVLIMLVLNILAFILDFFEINFLYKLIPLFSTFYFFYIYTITEIKEKKMKEIFLSPEKGNDI